MKCLLTSNIIIAQTKDLNSTPPNAEFEAGKCTEPASLSNFFDKKQHNRRLIMPTKETDAIYSNHHYGRASLAFITK